MNSITMVSIIIPTYNEEENIPRLLESIKGQIYPEEDLQHEVIVVDNGSTDRTVHMAMEFEAKVLIRPDESIAGLRNDGAKNSSGEILVFSDADNIFLTDTIHSVVAVFNSEDCDVVGPDGLRPTEPSSWMQRIWYFHTLRFDKPDQFSIVNNLSSGFLAIRRNVFEDIGGFNSSLHIGEDSDLSFRLRAKGFKLLRTNTFAIDNSGHPPDIPAFLKREFWHGDSLADLFLHKHIDSLTVYLFIHIAAIISLVIVSAIGNIYLMLALLFFLSLPPVFKALKKRARADAVASLSLVYFLYLCARSAALFKPGHSRK